jgi:hypothetical protein
MKEFNVTAQVYRLLDPHKQNLLINEIHKCSSSEEALSSFKLHFPSIEFSLIKVLSIEEIHNEF